MVPKEGRQACALGLWVLTSMVQVNFDVSLWLLFPPLFSRFLPLFLWLVCFIDKAVYTRVTVPKVCSLTERFCGQITLGNGGLNKVMGVS